MKPEQILGLTGGLISSILAAAIGCWQIILVVFIFYGLCLFGNLLTGLLYAHQSRTYSRERGRHAVYQKAGMIGGIIVVAILDILLMGLAGQGGITYSVPFLTFLLAGYAAVHELSSMLTNIKRLGNHVPGKLEEIVNEAQEAINQGKVPRLPNGGDAG